MMHSLKTNNFKKLAALALMTLMSFSIVSCGNIMEKEPTFRDGVSVGGMDISGLTMDEALNKFTDEFDSSFSIDITYDEDKWPISFEDILAEPDITSALNKAAENGMTDEPDNKNAEAQKEDNSAVNIDLTYTCDSAMLKDQLIEISDEINGEKQEEEKIGFDIDKTAQTVINRLAEGSFEPVEFELTEEEIAEQQKALIGSFSTAYSNDDKNRNENLRVACEKINGTVLQPGDIFDMNEALGPQTYENGYKAAGVIENGKIVSALGGGVCQVTTTIYNAAIRAELKIVERYNHSLMVGYVPIGLDAAVAGTYKNLRFQNDTDYPVYIETYLENNNVVCNIYGYEIHDSDRRVEFESVWVSTIGKPAAKITQDPNRYEDERIVTYNGKTGAKISTYKLVYEGDELISKEWFSSSTYVATADEVTVGTMKREPEVIEDVPVIGEVPSGTTTTPEISAPESSNGTASQPTVENPPVVSGNTSGVTGETGITNPSGNTMPDDSASGNIEVDEEISDAGEETSAPEVDNSNNSTDIVIGE